MLLEIQKEIRLSSRIVGLHDQEDKYGKHDCSRKCIQAQILTSRGCQHTSLGKKKEKEGRRKLDGKMSLGVKKRDCE